MQNHPRTLVFTGKSAVYRKCAHKYVTTNYSVSVTLNKIPNVIVIHNKKKRVSLCNDVAFIK